MATIIRAAGNIGPFKAILQYMEDRPVEQGEQPDRLRCDGVDYPLTVLGEFTISDDDSLAPVPVPDIEPRRANLRGRAIAARYAAIYSNISIPFPTTQKVIQFRDDVDRQNLSDKVTGAIALALGGQGSATMNYVCADNSVATMTAAQLVAAGLAVLAAKDAVFYSFKTVKDMIDAAETAEALDAAESALNALII